MKYEIRNIKNNHHKKLNTNKAIHQIDNEILWIKEIVNGVITVTTNYDFYIEESGGAIWLRKKGG
jgi:hypothetical protein